MTIMKIEIIAHLKTKKFFNEISLIKLINIKKNYYEYY